jgi:hypothetical protein
MTGKNPEYEIKRFEEISQTKDFLKRTGGEDVSSPGEKSVSSHRGEKPVRSPDTINAYRPGSRALSRMTASTPSMHTGPGSRAQIRRTGLTPKTRNWTTGAFPRESGGESDSV